MTHAIDVVVHTVVNVAEQAIEAAKHAAEVVAEAAKRAAEAAAAAIKKIALEVSNAVTVAIHYVDDVVHIVVNSIKDAMEIVGNFLAKIAVAIVDMVKFLLFLFDWEAILATHRILRDVMLNAMARVLDNGKIIEHVQHTVADVMAKIPGAREAAKLFDTAEAQANPQDRLAASPHAKVDGSQANGVSGSMLYSKVNQHREQPTSVLSGGSGGSDQLAQLEPAVLAMLTDIVGKPPGEIAKELLKFVQTDLAAEAVKAISSGLTEVNALAQPATLAVPIDVPFLSEIYRWITHGDRLTMLDMTCLLLAVPVNLVYAVISGGGHFNDDGKELPDHVKAGAAPHLRAVRAARPMLLAASGPTVEQPIPYSDLILCLLLVIRAGHVLLSFGVDAQFPETFGKRLDPTRNKLAIAKSLFGITNTTLTALSLAPRLNEWVGLDQTSIRISTYASLSLGCLGDLIGFVAAVKGSPPNPEDWDYTACGFHRLKVPLLVVKACYSVAGAIKLTTGGAPPAALAAYWLFVSSGIFSDLASFDDFLFTRTGADREGWDPAVYESAIQRRTALQAISATLQLAAGSTIIAAGSR